MQWQILRREGGMWNIENQGRLCENGMFGKGPEGNGGAGHETGRGNLFQAEGGARTKPWFGSVPGVFGNKEAEHSGERVVSH